MTYAVDGVWDFKIFLALPFLLPPFPIIYPVTRKQHTKINTRNKDARLLKAHNVKQ